MTDKPKVGCHYFFGNSPLNFWSNIDEKSIRDGLEYIKYSGFQSVFIIVPWAEFVGDRNNEISIQQYCDINYRNILKECRRIDLDIHVRVGYLWESRPAGTTTFERYSDFFSSPIHRISFTTFCRYLHDVGREIGGNIKYFFSWEDAYWPMFWRWRTRSMEDRCHLAEVTGYKTFLQLQGVEIDENTHIPNEHEENFMNFCQFYDSIILSNLLRIMKSQLGNIGMEYRIDSDLVEKSDGYDKYYHWPLCHPWVSQKYVYYHPNIFGYSETNLTAEQSRDRLRWVLHTVAPRLNVGERPLVLDQFNFIDNTEIGWAVTGNEQLDEFMRLAAQESHDRNVEVALWTTIDWPRDVLFNGTFKLGMEGWTLNGDPRIDPSDRKGVILDAGSSMSQRPQLSFPLDHGYHVYVELECRQGDAVVSVRTSNDHFDEVTLSAGPQTIDLTLSAYGGFLNLGCLSGSVVIRRVRLYDRYYSQGGRQPNGEEGSTYGYFKKHFLENRA